ncbi:MAG: hypothetical protein WB729_04245 [Candidatus Sulfotelmatobacter sp.]
MPFIAMCPPGRNNPAAFVAHNVNHNDLNIVHKADGKHAILAVAALNSLENRPIEDLRGILKINEMLREISPPLAFVPLEKH